MTQLDSICSLSLSPTQHFATHFTASLHKMSNQNVGLHLMRDLEVIRRTLATSLFGH